MVRIAVLVSGGGTNLQALIDAQAGGRIKNGEITAVVSSSPGAFALARAEKAGIASYVVARSQYDSRESFTDAVCDMLAGLDIGLVVLAGFMYILTDRFCREYKNCAINVHPSLIPSFCGEGFYGIHVHERALQYGVKLSGATVIFVSGDADGGPVILQKAVEVREDDTPKTLQERVMLEAEQDILPRAVSLFCEGRLRVEGRKALILPEGGAQDAGR